MSIDRLVATGTRKAEEVLHSHLRRLLACMLAMCLSTAGLAQCSGSDDELHGGVTTHMVRVYEDMGEPRSRYTLMLTSDGLAALHYGPDPPDWPTSWYGKWTATPVSISIVFHRRVSEGWWEPLPGEPPRPTVVVQLDPPDLVYLLPEAEGLLRVLQTPRPMPQEFGLIGMFRKPRSAWRED